MFTEHPNYFGSADVLNNLNFFVDSLPYFTHQYDEEDFISAVAVCFLSNVCIKPISTHSASAHHLKNCRLEIVALAFLSTSLRKTDAPVILMFFGWQFKTSPVWPSQSHSLYISRVVGCL